MNTSMTSATARAQTAVLATNKVVRNTYMLLSMTLLFSALTAGVSMVLKLPHPGLLLTLGGYFGLLFLTAKFRDSALGLAFVFALTGFMGYTLGPILNAYLAMANGGQVVMTAMGATGAIFLGLSGYALTTRRDFSFMGGFLMVGILVAFLAGLGAVFFEMPGSIPGGVIHVRAADGGTDPVRDQQHHPRRRDQLHHGDRDAVRIDFQPVHQPVAPAGIHE